MPDDSVSLGVLNSARITTGQAVDCLQSGNAYMKLQMRGASYIGLLAFSTVVSVQAQVGQAQFDVASVRLSDSKTMASQRVTDTRVDLVRIDLRQLLWMAFEIDPLCCRDRIQGAESLGGVFVDVHATIPTGATRKQVPAMLKSLLIQRFGLRTHAEPRPADVYELTVAESGIRMKEVPPASDLDKEFPADPSTKTFSDSVGETPTGRQRMITSALGIRMITDQSLYDRSSTARRTIQIDAVRMTMPDFASLLAGNIGRPVIDRTNLTGAYAFRIELPPEAWMMRIVAGVVPPTNEPTGISAPSAVEHLGLRLQPRRMSLDTIVIDRIERVPSEN